VVRSAFTVDDIFYPGYMNVSTPILYYNKSHWARAGLDPEDPPGTLEEVYEQARALRDAGVSDRPFVLKVSQNFFKNWVTAMGVEIVNEGNGRDGQPTEATFDTPETRELLEFLDRMNDEGLLNVYAATEGGINHYLALVQQESSMIIETSTASLTIRDALSGQISAADAGVDFDDSGIDASQLVPGAGPFPGMEEPGQVIPGGGLFYLLNTSDPAQQAGAWKFLRFMLEPENALQWHLQGGYLPVETSVSEQPEVQAFWEEDLGGLLLANGARQLEEADPDRPGPLIGPHVDYSDIVQRMMESILLDGADVDSALADAQAQLTESLERYAGTG
jgi:sn-glycerol 3-phosphate transport system substrate-binding protein